MAETVPLIFYLVAMVIGGYYYGREAVEKLAFE